LVVGALAILITGGDPILAYESLLKGAFGSRYGFGEMLLSTTPLLFSGLAVAFAFHCGLFNIGVEGQLTMGGMAAAIVGFSIQGLPPLLHLGLALAAGALMGAVWGGIPGYLKARLGVHEVINTIMLNYVAFAITGWLVSPTGPLTATEQLPASPMIVEAARLPRFWEGTRLTGGVFIAFVAAFVVWVILWHTRLGYRIRAVGKNATAAEYAGINVAYHLTASMAISGALGGLAGAVEVLGIHYRFFDSFSPGYGFDAIAIALVGQLHPLGVSAAALFFGALRAGAILMQQEAQVPRDIIFIVSGVIVFFMAANLIVARFAKFVAAFREKRA
jgi:simple sugar transport system permease protein